MTAVPARRRSVSIFKRKSIEHIQEEARRHELRRTLGPLNLVSLGIGAIIGAGIFVITGQVAAANAGPAILLSFVVAGIACALAGLCYAELASTMPVSGSAYTYAYGTMGEVFAWVMGWLLVLEYGVAASTVAVGWSGYVVSLLGDFGVVFPQLPLGDETRPAFATPLLQLQETAAGGLALQFTGTFNLLAAIGIAMITTLLVVGVSESANVNNAIVVVKLLVLIAFIGIGLSYMNPANWSPFIPANTGTFGEYGVSGIFRGAAIIFFAYVGFEAVSTAAAEAKNPQKDIPFGILGALIVCTVIYMFVALVLTGIVPYRDFLGVPDPIAVAVDRMNPTWADVGGLNLFSLMIKIGAVTGLTSVMLVLAYGQTRIFYMMSRDGLLPKVFSTIHPKFRTPWLGTIALGLFIMVGAAFLPISILGDLVSLGTATAFAIVCLATISLRITHPQLVRPFRVPGGLVIPVLGIIACLGLAGMNLTPMVLSAINDDPIPLMILAGYGVVGALVYIFYGYRSSLMGKGIEIIPDAAGTPPAEALGRGIRDGDA
ncbi:MAG: amino acid permease [Pseudomonadota bacterium]|nr:amino acid permease [Pseudomonadota bacterium]